MSSAEHKVPGRKLSSPDSAARASSWPAGFSGRPRLSAIDRESTLVQSYGPESRGGACSAQVIISDRPSITPMSRHRDILVCMSQAGYDKFASACSDEEASCSSTRTWCRSARLPAMCFAIPATRMAEELGRKMMANIIMLGFFTAVTGAVSAEAPRKPLSHSVPKGTEEMNLEAFHQGVRLRPVHSQRARKSRRPARQEPWHMTRPKDRLHRVIVIGATPQESPPPTSWGNWASR